MLGFMGNQDWQDMSDYLVHLTEARSFEVVLTEGLVCASGPYGAATNLAELGDSQHATCLSEIPLGMLGRLANRHGHWGVGFTRSFVRSRGGAPVWYLARETPQHAAFREVVRQAMCNGIDPGEPIWSLTPFVDYPGRGDWGTYEFEWEREWRVVGGLEFALNDVEFLFIPEEYQEAWRELWGSLGAQSPFSGAMLDATWGINRVQDELQRAGFAA